jgi:hypothetical protein
MDPLDEKEVHKGVEVTSIQTRMIPNPTNREPIITH